MDYNSQGANQTQQNIQYSESNSESANYNSAEQNSDSVRLHKFSKMNQQLAVLIEKVAKENAKLRFLLKDHEFCDMCHKHS